MSIGDAWAVINESGTQVASVDQSGNLIVAGTVSSTSATPDDFGAAGIKADVIAESTNGAGVTIDGAKVLDGFLLDTVGFYDPVAPTKRVRLDAGTVTAGQTRVLAMPDENVTITSAGAALLDDAAAVNQRTTLGLAIGTDVQAYDAGLTSLALLATAADRLPYATGVDTYAEAVFTAAGRALVDDATAAAQLITLGIADTMLVAAIAVGDATGGSTDAALTLQLSRLDGTTPIASARQVMILSGAVASMPWYSPPAVASVAFATATTGSIIASGAGWALVQTDATGAFACTATNSDDETIQFYVAGGFAASATYACQVMATNFDAATWSA
jgi:ribosomal protein S16